MIPGYALIDSFSSYFHFPNTRISFSVCSVFCLARCLY